MRKLFYNIYGKLSEKTTGIRIFYICIDITILGFFCALNTELRGEVNKEIANVIFFLGWIITAFIFGIILGSFMTKKRTAFIINILITISVVMLLILFSNVYMVSPGEFELRIFGYIISWKWW